MIELIFWVYVFLQILYLLVILDIILSWVSIFMWKNVCPQFLINLLRPIYTFIKKHIPTTFWPFEFTPFIVLIAISFLQHIFLIYFPEISRIVQLYSFV